MKYNEKHNVCLYTPEEMGANAYRIPTIKATGEYFAVPCDVINMQAAAKVGLPVFSPIMRDYDWPSNKLKVPAPFDHQKIMSSFLTVNPRSFNLCDLGCVDAETEYLSPTGWRRMDEYDGGLVAQYHLDGRAEFVEPEAYVKKPCEAMYRFKTKYGVDQKLSDGHRVLYVTGSGKPKVCSAQEVVDTYEKNVMGWKGKFITTFKLGGAGIDLSDAELRVQVAVIADGSFPNKSDACVVRVKRERKKVRLRRLLEEAGIPFTEASKDYPTAVGFTVFRFKAPRRDKEFTSFYWGCTADQLQIICDEAPEWDGSRKKTNDMFFSCSKLSADFVQYAFSASGRTCRMVEDVREGRRTGYVLIARKRAALVQLNGSTADGVKTNPISVEPTPDGFMYCFKVPTSFLVFRRNGCVFMSGNTGKTLGTLWAYHYLKKQGLVHKALILSPLSTLRRVWQDTILDHFMGHLTCEVLHGDRAKRIANAHKDVDVYIMNHDGLAIGKSRDVHGRMVLGELTQFLTDHPEIDCIIVDEGSMYKDSGTGRFKYLRQLVKNKPYLWWLTGTPTPNAPTDAWSQAKLVRPDYSESFRDFRDRTMTQINMHKWTPKATAVETVSKLLQPAIRFDRDDCLDLPPCTYTTLDVELSSDQKKAYDELKKTLRTHLAEGPVSALNEGVLRLKLIQVACGAVYSSDRDVRLVDCKPRIQALNEIVEQTSGKLLVFCPLISVTEMVAAELRKQYSLEIINGSVSATKRNQVFLDFQQSEEPRIIVADPRTMAHGLTLTAAATIVWYAPIDMPEIYTQANGRINRPGQTKSTHIFRLAASPIEREIFRRLDTKESMQGAILDLIKKGD